MDFAPPKVEAWMWLYFWIGIVMLLLSGRKIKFYGPGHVFLILNWMAVITVIGLALMSKAGSRDFLTAERGSVLEGDVKSDRRGGYDIYMKHYVFEPDMVSFCHEAMTQGRIGQRLRNASDEGSVMTVGDSFSPTFYFTIPQLAWLLFLLAGIPWFIFQFTSLEGGLRRIRNYVKSIKEEDERLAKDRRMADLTDLKQLTDAARSTLALIASTTSNNVQGNPPVPPPRPANTNTDNTSQELKRRKRFFRMSVMYPSCGITCEKMLIDVLSLLTSLVGIFVMGSALHSEVTMSSKVWIFGGQMLDLLLRRENSFIFSGKISYFWNDRHVLVDCFAPYASLMTLYCLISWLLLVWAAVVSLCKILRNVEISCSRISRRYYLNKKRDRLVFLRYGNKAKTIRLLDEVEKTPARFWLFQSMFTYLGRDDLNLVLQYLVNSGNEDVSQPPVVTA